MTNSKLKMIQNLIHHCHNPIVFYRKKSYYKVHLRHAVYVQIVVAYSITIIIIIITITIINNNIYCTYRLIGCNLYHRHVGYLQTVVTYCQIL